MLEYTNTMDKVEKIKAEIERRISLICSPEGIVMLHRVQEYETLRDIDDFIDSLQSECVADSDKTSKVVKNDHFDEELDELVCSYLIDHKHDMLSSSYSYLLEFAKIIANWSMNHFAGVSKMENEDLDKEITAIHERYPEVSFAKLSRICVRVANWQKEQMMKDAVTARVSIDEFSCGLYNLCVEQGLTSEDDVTLFIIKNYENPGTDTDR